MKTNQDFSFPRGDDHEIEFTIVDDDDEAKSLTGATSVKWELYQGGIVIIQKDLDDGVALINVDGTNDGVKVTLEPSDTVSLNDGLYIHELECVIGGKRLTLAQGSLLLLKDYILN